MRKEKLMAFYKKYNYFFKAALMALLPLLCCVITCAAQGRAIGEVYLPNGEWNDELFYFKQVEGMVKYGYPYGYFGFNESHALKLSFAAWSPVLVFPWILWGKLFGWTLLSPVYCNIFLMMLSMFLFVILVKPSNRQLGILTILFSVFRPFTRYMLSGMPEVICFSLLIVFYALAVSYMGKGGQDNGCSRNGCARAWKLAVMFVISVLLTLMRPYFVLFALLPAFLWIRRSKWAGAVGSVLVLALTGGLYAAIKHYLGAEYFAPLFDTTWVTTFFTDGIFAGIKYTLGTLWNVGRIFASMTIESFRSGLPAGARFAGFLTIMLVLVWQSIVDWRKKNWNRLLLNGHLAVCFAGMLAALLLMYKMDEGSKHLLAFIAVGIFAVSLMETVFFKKAMFVGAVFVFVYTVKANSAYEYQIPFENEERKEAVEAWEQVFEEELELEKAGAPSYENVVIWTFTDETPEGTAMTSWQILYALPEGFGISCCKSDYLMENFDSLKSRYIVTVSGGQLDERCADAEYEEVKRLGGEVLYRRY